MTIHIYLLDIQVIDKGNIRRWVIWLNTFVFIIFQFVLSKINKYKISLLLIQVFK